jgi:hypothetical protein
MRYGRQNQPVRVPIENMLVDPPAQTYLSGDLASGVSSLTMANITNFAVNQILLIGDPGNQNSEIIKSNASTPPSAGAIPLAANTVYAHTADTPVTVMRYDQVEISTATTITGTKTVLGSILTIPANQITTDYNDTAGSSGYYFARWKNSITSTFSSYSEPSPVTAYTMFSARAIIDAALAMINKETSKVFSDEYAFQQIDACQMEVLREFKRWSFMQSFNTIIGQTEEGTWKIAVPVDLDEQMTYKSIWNFRVGKEYDMCWVDKAEFDALIQGIGYSTALTGEGAGGVSITLVSSNDFTDSGSVRIGANTYTFTANDKSTGTLSLDSPLLDDVSADQDVFQYASLGYPTYWTIWDGFIYHWPITSSQYAGRNYWLDYYKKLIETTDDSQAIILPDPTVVQYYLAWKFLLRMNNGEETVASTGFYNNYILRREKMKQKESTNRNFILSPDLGGSGYIY